MVRSANQILKLCDYYINCEVNDKNEIDIICSFDNDSTVNIKYDSDSNQIIINENAYACTDYAYPVLTRYFITEICRNYQYPTHFVSFIRNNNPTSTLMFDGFGDLSQKLNILVNEVVNNGLSKEIIQLAKEEEVFEGLQQFLLLYLGEKVG